MPGPTKPDTIKLERARRQFFQFHIVENEPILRVKELMDDLSNDAGEDFVVGQGQWEGRRRYWGFQSPTAWNIRKGQRGEGVPIPPEIVDLPLWRVRGRDVGDWSKAGLGRGNRSGPREKFVPNGSSEALKELDQHQVICDGKDVQDWSLVLNSSGSSSSSNLSSISSTDSYASAYALPSDQRHSEQTPIHAFDDLCIATEMFHTGNDVHPPQFPWADQTTNNSCLYKTSGSELGQTPRAARSSGTSYFNSSHAQSIPSTGDTGTPYTAILANSSAACFNILAAQHSRPDWQYNDAEQQVGARDAVYHQPQFRNAAYPQAQNVLQLERAGNAGNFRMDPFNQPIYREAALIAIAALQAEPRPCVGRNCCSHPKKRIAAM